MSNTDNKTKTQNNTENTFPAKQLPAFSPYQVMGIETITKPVSGTTKEGRTYAFDSKSHILTIKPMKNTSLALTVSVFDAEYQALRAVATLYGGFDKCWITTTIDNSSNSRVTKFNHTGQLIAK